MADAIPGAGTAVETALVILAHGFGANTNMSESARLFRIMAERIAGTGMGALMFDFMGHGLSDGDFTEMTPNTRIADLEAVLDYARARHSGRIILLGLSMGAAVAIHVTAKRQSELHGLLTWSAVPNFDPAAPSATWFVKPADEVFAPSQNFIADRPTETIGEAYARISLPKLQIQGDADYPHFLDEFQDFYTRAPEPKRHIIVAGGDHAFTKKAVREEVIRHSLDWLREIAG